MAGFLAGRPQVASVMRLAAFSTLLYSLVDKNHNSLARVWEIGSSSHLWAPVTTGVIVFTFSKFLCFRYYVGSKIAALG